MAATLKQFAPYDPVAEELWRIAETGEVDALDQIFLRRVDVNARNKHGMTALMRAAYHGHERMVRTLLQHGADPNLSRNDKFTALALAAFFGHTGTVRILIEHGAKREVITRCGASAHTWATARIFEDAARYLASPIPAPAPVARFTPAPTPVSAAPAPVSEIRTLKDPPEIWDLVQEVPRDFNAGSAFVTRLKSMKASFVLGIAAVVLVSAAGVIGLVVRRGSVARSLPSPPAARQNVVGSDVSVPSKIEDTGNATAVTPPAPEATELANHSEAPITNDKRLRKGTSPARQTRPTTPAEEPVQTVESREAPAAPPVTVATPKPEPRKTAVSPQLISPTPNAPKGKVIQWP
jgi:Ankyrin repeats (3 copies)